MVTWNFRVASDFFQTVASSLELVGTKGFQTVWKQSNFVWKKLGFRIKSDRGFVDLATSSRFLFVLEVWFRMLCYTRLYRNSEASEEIPTVSWGLPWARLIKMFKTGICFGMVSGPASGIWIGLDSRKGPRKEFLFSAVSTTPIKLSRDGS